MKNDDEVLTGQTSIDDFVKDDLSIHYEESPYEINKLILMRSVTVTKNK